MLDVESVTAPRILACICDGVSVNRIRDLTSGADLDILTVGSLSERMRRVGANTDWRSKQTNEIGKTHYQQEWE